MVGDNSGAKGMSHVVWGGPFHSQTWPILWLKTIKWGWNRADLEDLNYALAHQTSSSRSEQYRDHSQHVLILTSSNIPQELSGANCNV